MEFQFETNIVGYLIRYYLICGILVSLISSISFMIKPSIVPGRIGLLITIFLVLASFFSLAQVLILFIHKTKIIMLNIYKWLNDVIGSYWGIYECINHLYHQLHDIHFIRNGLLWLFALHNKKNRKRRQSIQFGPDHANIIWVDIHTF